jgi:MFS family permease
MLFTLGAGFSKSIASLLVCRFLAGLLGSPVLSVGAGSNADLWPQRSRANSVLFFLLAPFLGTAIGPLVGGFAAQHKGWRWTQWCILFIGMAAWVGGLTMQETYKKTILQKRAKRLGIEPPKSNLPSGWARAKILLTVTLFRPVHMLLFEPIVLFLSMYSAFTFGVLYAFLPAFTLVFEGVYGFDISKTGLTYLPIGIGCMLAVPTALACDRWIYQKQHAKAVKAGHRGAAPEHRLYSAMMGGFGVTIGLFWFGWSARKDVHWIVPIIGAAPFGWGNLCVFVSRLRRMTIVAVLTNDHTVGYSAIHSRRVWTAEWGVCCSS